MRARSAPRRSGRSCRGASSSRATARPTTRPCAGGCWTRCTRAPCAAASRWGSRSTSRRRGLASGRTLALGRAETSWCQRARLSRPVGRSTRAGLVKSTATMAVMSATEIVVAGDEAPLAQLLSMICMISWARGLLASPQAATCGTSSWAAAGCRWRKAAATQVRRPSSMRRFHISTMARCLAPLPNRAGSGFVSSK